MEQMGSLVQNLHNMFQKYGPKT